MQKDVTSCGLLSVEVLRECMMNEDFMAKVFSCDYTNINLEKMSLAQGIENGKYLDDETSRIYVDARDGRNYKANYLSHHLLLNVVLSDKEITSYNKYLSKLTKRMIREIDEMICEVDGERGGWLSAASASQVNPLRVMGKEMIVG